MCRKLTEALINSINLCLLFLDAGLGIFAKERFESDVVFGPYGGEKIDVADVAPNMDQSYMWDVRALWYYYWAKYPAVVAPRSSVQQSFFIYMYE